MALHPESGSFGAGRCLTQLWHTSLPPRPERAVAGALGANLGCLSEPSVVFILFFLEHV